MGLFSKFKKNKLNNDIVNNSISSVNNFLNELSIILDKDEFISKSSYHNLVNNYKDDYNFLKQNEKENTLDSYCKNKNIDIKSAKEFINSYEEIMDNNIESKIIKQHNQEFYKNELNKEKDFFDNVLKDIDKNIILDEEQRIAAICDEDNTLIIAGAGAGKTTTLAAKVSYLIEKKNIKPEDILIIAFTNKAVNELKDKVNKKLGYNVPISTFHSCGRAITKKDDTFSDSSILDDNFWFVQNFMKSEVEKDRSLLQKLIMLFAYYLDINEEIIGEISKEDHFTLLETSDFTSLKGNLGEINKQIINRDSKRKVTINNEFLRSNEEVQIANFLYLNSIDYEYERIYPYSIPNSNKLYTPDFYIKQGNKECYIEHFGITEDGKNDRYSAEELQRYVLNMNSKKLYHETYHTDLICTYSKYNDNVSLLRHLKEELVKRGFILNKRSDEEVFKKIKNNENSKYLYKFTKIACQFINLFKAKDYQASEFEVLKSKTKNPRNLIFLDIMQKLYLSYQLFLKENKLVDFQDMINESSRLLRESEKVRDKINFKYVIIDEFQDISRARLNLVNEIKNATQAKICVVGDDWQAIYAYAGSDINLFTHFKEEMGYAEILKITHTYRNSQELIDIAGDFIQKNESQIKKKLISPKSIDKPISVYTYDGSYKSKDNKGSDYNKAELLEKVLKMINNIGIKEHGEEYKQNILIIARYNFEGDKLLKSGLFIKNEKNQLVNKKYKNINITFMTAHATKGLTFDNVVIINAINAKFGFPSQIVDDPLFKFVRTKDESFDFSEERRLFYVAMTRTKNRVFILTPAQNPSKFVLELLEEYKDKINLHEEDFKLNRKVEYLEKNSTKCPVCGYPLLPRFNEAYGLRLYVCTNEPEACGYMTNNLASGKKGIHICSKCGTGIMHVKRRKDGSGYFFGCSNYNDGKGCKNIEDFDV